MVSFENVSKFVLSDISLHIPAGMTVGVIGASGSGKTTLLRLACGLLKCEQGNVRTFLVDPVKKRRQISRDIRVFFSDRPVFQEDSTIIYEFQKLRAVYGLNQEEFQRTYRSLARQLQFEAYEETEIRQLSLGQRRRGELATVLLGAPRLILLDEPTSGLDEQAKSIFWKLLKKQAEAGTAIMISSHNLIEEEQLCDRVILLDGGRLLYYGEQDRLMRKYAPVHEMELTFGQAAPDVEDLPLIRYRLENDKLSLRYNSNVISASEIIGHFMGQAAISQMRIVRPQLEDVVVQRKENRDYELFSDIHKENP